MWLLKLFISVLIIPLFFCIVFCYLGFIQKLFKLKDDDYGYTFLIGIGIIVFCRLVYEIYINLPF